jgi:multidrug resistance protein
MILFITVLIDMTGFGMIIPLIPFYAQNLGATAAGIGILLTSFNVMQLVFSPILGKVSDQKGRRPILLFSIFTSIASFILFSFAENYLMLFLSRIIAGLATEGGVAQAYVADITTKEERAQGLGKVGAAFGIGFILGPVLGGLLSPYGFKIPGYAAIILSVINFVFVWLWLPEPKVLTATQSSGGLRTSAKKMLGVLKKPLTGQAILIFFGITLAFSAVPIIVPLLAIVFYGFSEVEMSYVFIYIGIIQAILQGLAIKRLVKTFGEEKLIVLGTLSMFLGMTAMPLFSQIILFFLTLTLISFGTGLINTVIPSFVSQRTPPEEQGGILGIIQSVGSIARIPGPVIAGLTYELFGVTASFSISAIILAIQFLIGCRVFQACQLKKERE